MKKEFSLTILCLLASWNISFAQPRLPGPMSRLDSLMSVGDIKNALTEYRKQFTQTPNDVKNIYNMACALSLDQQVDSSFKYLYLAVKLDTSTNALIDPDLLSIRENKQWIDFENTLIAMINKKSKGSIKDIDYAKSLWRLMALDQAYFYEIGIAVRNLGFTSPVVTAMQKLKQLLNERNQRELEELISKKGWPKISEVGTAAAGAPFYVIQHSNAEIQKKYISFLQKRCEEKEANWSHYAMLYDRMKMNQNLPQKYGTQMNLNNRNTGTFELYQLEDKTKVNEWRKEVGLPPLKEYPN